MTKIVTVGDVRNKIKDLPDNLPIDFGCQCDSFDIWELRIGPHYKEAILSFYLMEGVKENCNE